MANQIPLGEIIASSLDLPQPSPIPGTAHFGNMGSSTINHVPVIGISTTSPVTPNTLAPPNGPASIPSTSGSNPILTVLTRVITLTSPAIPSDVRSTTPSDAFSTKATTTGGHSYLGGDVTQRSLHVALGYTFAACAVLLGVALMFAIKNALKRDNSKKSDDVGESPVVYPITDSLSVLPYRILRLPRPKLRTTWHNI